MFRSLYGHGKSSFRSRRDASVPTYGLDCCIASS
jgi:hypothetical protein